MGAGDWALLADSCENAKSSVNDLYILGERLAANAFQ